MGAEGDRVGVALTARAIRAVRRKRDPLRSLAIGSFCLLLVLPPAAHWGRAHGARALLSGVSGLLPGGDSDGRAQGSACGADDAHRSAQERPRWSEYRCMTQREVGSTERWSQCLRRVRYSNTSGRGCDLNARCCAPADTESEGRP